MLCKFKEVLGWYGDHDDPRIEDVINTHKYIGKTLRSVICDVYRVKRNDIKNNPWLFQLCCEPIIDYGILIDHTFSQKCISKSPKPFDYPNFDEKHTKLLWLELLNEDNYNYGRERKYFCLYDDHIDNLDTCSPDEINLITILRKPCDQNSSTSHWGPTGTRRGT